MRVYCRNNLSESLFIFCLIYFVIALHAADVTEDMLIVRETDNGTINHTVTIEAPGRFRLGFAASYNYGLSEWYDLINDPDGKRNIAKDVVLHFPAHAQGALFNQVIARGDFIGHILAAKTFFPNEPRKLEIIENNRLRAVIEIFYYPMIAYTINRQISFKTRYVVYSTGGIFITNTMQSLADQEIYEWRNSVIGLGDPSFMPHGDSGENLVIKGKALSDPAKNWKTDRWAGSQLNQGYNTWEIESNTANTLRIGKQLSGSKPLREGSYSIGSRHDKHGWIRSTNLQDPHIWHKDRARYLFMYWDPTTPEPYNSWTKANILLVPRPGNPHQGGQSHHEWRGFKRFYYHIGNIPLKKGEKITQRYMIQLGTKGSALLPDISSRRVADAYADDYLSDHRLEVSRGSVVDEGFDFVEGCYTLCADRNKLAFVMNGDKSRKIKPAFRIQDYSSGKPPQLRVNGELKKPGESYLYHQLNSNTLLVQFLFDVDSKAKIELVGDLSLASGQPALRSRYPETPKTACCVIRKIPRELRRSERG